MSDLETTARIESDPRPELTTEPELYLAEPAVTVDTVTIPIVIPTFEVGPTGEALVGKELDEPTPETLKPPRVVHDRSPWQKNVPLESSFLDKAVIVTPEGGLRLPPPVPARAHVAEQVPDLVPRLRAFGDRERWLLPIALGLGVTALGAAAVALFTGLI